MKPGATRGEGSAPASDTRRRPRQQQQPGPSPKGMQGTRIKESSTQTDMMLNPMKRPNSRKGLSADARLAKNEAAVVAVLANDVFPPRLKVQMSRGPSSV
mmetsp:Transcript_125066/g.361787  ORF Transcript_125066/g.361787 Transcript_125066/m.361787 type:complete len:100 (-) Transcript_125066:829-1128(-)